MSPHLSRFRSSRTAPAVAAVLLAMLLLTIAAATWNPLHEWLHGDADEADHHCAITLFASGTCDTSLVAETIAPLPLPLPADRIVVLKTWVPNVFLSACVYEHGPPGNS